jgi:hypothetical protein
VSGDARAIAAPALPRQALTTRFLDFWLLGGLSILVWLVMFATQGFRAAWAIDQQFKNLTFTTASLSLLVNYPHFLISYKLAYSRGQAFVTRHAWQLVVVPILMVATFAWAYAQFNVPATAVTRACSPVRGSATSCSRSRST